MKDKASKKTGNPLDKSSEEQENEFINVFRYFENANIRNRDAFCELLDYSKENIRHPK